MVYFQQQLAKCAGAQVYWGVAHLVHSVCVLCSPRVLYCAIRHPLWQALAAQKAGFRLADDQPCTTTGAGATNQPLCSAGDSNQPRCDNTARQDFQVKALRLKQGTSSAPCTIRNEGFPCWPQRWSAKGKFKFVLKCSSCLPLILYSLISSYNPSTVFLSLLFLARLLFIPYFLHSINVGQ